METIRTILVPTDFGEPAERAVDLAVLIGEKFESSLTLLHVYSVPVAPYMEGFDLRVGDYTKAASKALDEAVAKIKNRYARVEPALTSGVAWEQIVDFAKDRAVDLLIVMGTHGRRGMSRLLVGSVAEKVLRMSPVPVLTVGPGPGDGPESLRRRTP